jgi:hypothetical protein
MFASNSAVCGSTLPLRFGDSRVQRALLNVFQQDRDATHGGRIGDAAVLKKKGREYARIAQKVRRAAVLGAGIMGASTMRVMSPRFIASSADRRPASNIP